MNSCGTIKAKAKIPILSRYADLKGWHGEDYGPVTCEELSTIRRNSVILFDSELHPGKISEWTLRTDPSREIKYYICVLCRRLQDKGRREIPPIQFGKAARIVVRNGRFLTHPDHPTIPHICGFDENPMSDRCSVLSRRAMLRARTEISEDGSTAQQKIDEIIARFRSDPKYAHLSGEELMNIERIVRNSKTALNMSSSLSMSRSRLKSKAKSACMTSDSLSSSVKSRRIYECPIVGCSFITYVTAMLDVHICEKHKTADDPSQQNQNVSYKDCDSESVSDGLNDQQGASTLLSKRHYSLVFFRSRTNPGKISEWSKDGLKGETSAHYSCVLCRKIKSKTNRSNQNVPTELGPPAGIIIRNGRFIIDPDYPNPPHICNFANNPLSNEVEVLKRRSQLLRRDYIKAKQQAKDKRKMMGGGMFFVNTVESEDEEEQETAAVENANDDEYNNSTTSSSEAFRSISQCSLSYPNSYAVENRNDRLSSNENLHGNIVFEIKSNQDGITKSITKQIEVCEDGVNDATESNSSDSDPKYECSIVGCNFRTGELQQLNNHLIDHESLDEIDNLDHIQQEIIISAECTDSSEIQSHSEIFRNGILSPYLSSTKVSQNTTFSPTLLSSVPSDQVSNRCSSLLISSTGSMDPECSQSPSKHIVDFGGVVYEAVWNADDNNENNNQSTPIILFDSVRYPGRISEWTIPQSNNNYWCDRTTKPNEIKCYSCMLCEERRIERMTALNEQIGSVNGIDTRPFPSAQILVCNSRFLTHPDYPLGEHSCEFETNSLSLGESVLSQRPYVVRERYNDHVDGDRERSDAYELAKAIYERGDTSLSLPSSPSKPLVIKHSSEHHQSPSTSQRSATCNLLVSNMDDHIDVENGCDESVISDESNHDNSDIISRNFHTSDSLGNGDRTKASFNEHQFYLNIESDTNFLQSPPEKKRRTHFNTGQGGSHQHHISSYDVVGC